MSVKVFQSSDKTAPNHGVRNMVSALANALLDACHRFVGMVKLQKNQFHPVPRLLPLPDVAQIGAARQGGFKGEALTQPEVTFQFGQHQPSGLYRRSFRGKRRQARSDQVGIHKHRASRLVGQELPCKRGFSRPVGAGNNDDLAILMRHHSSSA